ncbi:hypothetical protein SAMN05421823_108221 [Catalinimonas alkaloidigena]|uniref:Uncharacterized protein n=1 Tax=Catalinimonas alkaloidigena TaxID=1075417 RepID=A0A1G9N9B9_9BACT|nr:hypothetical protein [Catalinimonas alkaloidigena]SDL83069.1 hypothetical protein SAMN05421823_108221 [Catalinimonas alkaloidigena]
MADNPTAEDLIAMIERYQEARLQPYQTTIRAVNPTFQDARACWFSADQLLKMLGIAKTAAQLKQEGTMTQNLSGVRFYYAAEEDLKHTLVMVSTESTGEGDTDNDQDETLENGGKLCPPNCNGAMH